MGGNPLVTKASDESGSTTTVVDLLGQVTSYTDVNGAVTTFKYDIHGRKTSETSAVKGVTSTLAYGWTNASRLNRLDLDGTTVATPVYNAGLLQSVAYGNNSSLGLTYNGAASVTALTWKTGGTTVTDTVTRSRDQRITDDVITDTAGGGARYEYAYTYDGVGRLTGATIPHHELVYNYAPDNGCGPNKKAGQNTNRTSMADSLNGGLPVTTLYCYDDADRLLSTTGATALSFEYDAYGNAIKVGTDTLGYDSTRRHITTSTAAGNSVKYTRDVTDRITARTVQTGTDPEKVTRYGFISNSGGPEFVLDSVGVLRQRIVKLPGGVVLTKNYTGTKATNWAYPAITGGSILFTADGTGARTSAVHLYDPFGQTIDPVTGQFKDIPIPSTAEGGMDFGYLGQHTVPVEHIASQQALEMGARTYLPVLGRFLQTDPISGGSANNYEYCNADPINYLDLTGKWAALAIPVIAVGLGGLAAGAAGAALALATGGTSGLNEMAVEAGVGAMASLMADDNASNQAPPAKETPAAQTTPDPGISGGGTARATPYSWVEEEAMKYIQANPERGEVLEGVKMSDSERNLYAEDGWVKMEYAEVGEYNIHYEYNTRTGEATDFKFL
ncbi:RHS repeat-associated core domain-containing protein [Nocardia crassostreae]|uniref:RHS repeat-associated core domain-containing protein n=1 Tax=Nocardia crassostreae TaxID=53428 RepID=UPI00082F14A2|nr:RHS repeat-associated core domain-containing protein [Nocardia crassostreae]